MLKNLLTLMLCLFFTSQGFSLNTSCPNGSTIEFKTECDVNYLTNILRRELLEQWKPYDEEKFGKTLTVNQKTIELVQIIKTSEPANRTDAE